LGDTPTELECALRSEFPQAQITRDEDELQAHLQILLHHLERKAPHLNLPLDVQATAFQRRVWQELRAIGYGQTRTYSQVAQALGQPSAVRAVARACATNPVALAIPCHRVVREGGALAGYRWGLERKKALLKNEK
jgi:AraC family transcriptional regulator of adaptative response/methylated-DNA-[protein]-cysteine methyltransferase